jgi:hypothetical protein
VSAPFEPFGSQDKNDDDAAVIDSFFIETDAPPDIKQAMEYEPQEALKPPPVITRLLTGDITVSPDWTATLLLPSDAKRKSITIRIYSPTAIATDGVRFSDERGNILTSGKLLHNSDSVFTNHTGALWYIACGAAADGKASAPVSLEYWSVTE